MIVDLTKRISVCTRKSLIRLILCLLPLSSPASSAAQDLLRDLPDSAKPAYQNNEQQPEQQKAGTVTGTVIDQSGALITGAHVTLSIDDQPPRPETLTDDDGRFFFNNVPAGPFQLTITSADLTPQTLKGTLHPSEAYVAPAVMLTVATQVTEVHVGLAPAELAEVQVQEQEKQRVFGVIPNFYVSYVPNAAPLTTKLKFGLAWKSSIDPVTFAAVGVIAGVQQAANTPNGYGQGAQGYAKRYGAAYANVAVGTFLGGAALPTLLRQDPRYFYQGTGTKKSRLLHALASSFICKSDNGHWQPNYSNVGGNFAAGAISTLYYPKDNRSAASLAISTALIRLGETTIANVFQEFLIPKLTPNLPTRAPIQP